MQVLCPYAAHQLHRYGLLSGTVLPVALVAAAPAAVAMFVLAFALDSASCSWSVAGRRARPLTRPRHELQRVDGWRATFWMPWDGEKLVGDFTQKPAAVELYNHAADTEDNFDA